LETAAVFRVNVVPKQLYFKTRNPGILNQYLSGFQGDFGPRIGRLKLLEYRFHSKCDRNNIIIIIV